MESLHLNGYLPDPESDKDYVYGQHWKAAPVEAASVDLRAYSRGIQDQRQTGSCVAHAVIKAIEIRDALEGKPHVDYSTLHLYYLSRNLQVPRKTHVDAGTHIRLACDAARKSGVCLESEWPFLPSKVNRPPSWLAMQSAYRRKIDGFYRIRARGEKRLEEIRECLRGGYPVIFGTAVDETWHRYQEGSPDLKPAESPTGRHATVLVGYGGDRFIGENSWGASWGVGGFYYAHESLLVDSATRDIWVVKS
jgi:C1A family cysteine protease